MGTVYDDSKIHAIKFQDSKQVQLHVVYVGSQRTLFMEEEIVKNKHNPRYMVQLSRAWLNTKLEPSKQEIMGPLLIPLFEGMQVWS
jgi:hypothetical protein